MMSLFPAYATENLEADNLSNKDDSPELALAMETELLASETEEDDHYLSRPASPSILTVKVNEDFYLDNKLDCGNYRVSTLYYPGRPQYTKTHPSLGLEKTEHQTRKLSHRYYEEMRSTDIVPAEEVSERITSFQRMLADTPHDVELWLKYIDFQECYTGEAGALSAAEAAHNRAPHSARLRARYYVALHRALPIEKYLSSLRDQITAEKCPYIKTELWVRLVGGAGTAGGPVSASTAAAGALQQLRHHTCAYHQILFVYGAFLRSAGLWEQLVLLLELVAAMNFPSAGFPPPLQSNKLLKSEETLRDYEEKVISSGLPLNTVWCRVERARAAAHWRPAVVSRDVDPGSDPQRAPLPADVADLLVPVVGAPRLCDLAVTMLRLVKVPLFPSTGYVLRAAAGSLALEEITAWEASEAETLLSLVRAARRLPPGHPARAQSSTARRLLVALLDPPHYCDDEHGFLSWVSSLWEACCTWVEDEKSREAVLCWRLRWMHALLLLVDNDEGGNAEIRRIRNEAREALKRYARDSPLAFAQFARIELAAGGPVRAGHVALQAMRAALGSDCPVLNKLYVARVVCEVSKEGRTGNMGRWALVCAVLGRSLPADLDVSPSADLLHLAYTHCIERCEELEREFEESGVVNAEDNRTDDMVRALLPCAGEWGSARALLAPPEDLHRLYLRALSNAGGVDTSARAARYWEQCACALVSAAGGRGPAYARALSSVYPHNALLALMSGGAPLWAWEPGTSQEVRLRSLVRCETDVVALGALLPPLLSALNTDHIKDWERVCRVSRRVCRSGRGALVWAVRLEAEARAAHPRLKAALYAALDALSHHKWLYVRGAMWCSSESAALADLLLEKQLRLHALPDELLPLEVGDPVTADSAQTDAEMEDSIGPGGSVSGS